MHISAPYDRCVGGIHIMCTATTRPRTPPFKRREHTMTWVKWSGGSPSEASKWADRHVDTTTRYWDRRSAGGSA